MEHDISGRMISVYTSEIDMEWYVLSRDAEAVAFSAASTASASAST